MVTKGPKQKRDAETEALHEALNDQKPMSLKPFTEEEFVERMVETMRRGQGVNYTPEFDAAFTAAVRQDYRYFTSKANLEIIEKGLLDEAAASLDLTDYDLLPVESGHDRITDKLHQNNLNLETLREVFGVGGGAGHSEYLLPINPYLLHQPAKPSFVKESLRGESHE